MGTVYSLEKEHSLELAERRRIQAEREVLEFKRDLLDEDDEAGWLTLTRRIRFLQKRVIEMSVYNFEYDELKSFDAPHTRPNSTESERPDNNKYITNIFQQKKSH